MFLLHDFMYRVVVKGEVSRFLLGFAESCVCVELVDFHIRDGRVEGSFEGFRTLAQEACSKGFHCEDLNGNLGAVVNFIFSSKF
jgi:hypothetical protein